MICNACKSLSAMTACGFCSGSFSILLKYHGKDIVEIRRIPVGLADSLKEGAELVIGQTLESLDDESLLFSLAQFVLVPCNSILEYLGFEQLPDVKGSTDRMLMLFRLTASLIDAALISYVGSHGSRFDTNHIHEDRSGSGPGCGEIGLYDRRDSLAFKCSLNSLTCLADLIGREQKVWVFTFSYSGHIPNKPDLTEASRPLSVLTKIEDLADIWGPVWTIPTESGRIRHYALSKGVIFRIDKECEIAGAIQCHYEIHGRNHGGMASIEPWQSQDMLIERDVLNKGALLAHSCSLCTIPICIYGSFYKAI